MNQEVGNRRLAAQDLLQNYLGSWELPPVDLAGLAIQPEDALLPVGGMLPGQEAVVDMEGNPIPVPGGPGDPNIPSTWRGNASSGYIVPEGHQMAGCTLVQGPCSNQQGGCNPGARGQARYVCPAGHPVGSRGAGANLDTIMRR